MKKDTFNILQEIQEAEMILIGLGEEFDDVKALKQMPGYTETRQKIAEDGNQWLLPALNEFYGRQRSHVEEGLKNLAKVLAGKNYFVLSVSTNEAIRNIPWKEDRLVMPCGGSAMKQCSEKCGHEITEITGDDRALLDSCFEKGENFPEQLGVCPVCHSPMILNNVYTEKYNEDGYLDMWKIYTKWLQGTLNRKLLILELGVGMQYPSVIRWPFEKIGFYNQKAKFCRVNESLYQLTEEIADKGVSISQNAIDWLRFLC